MTSPDDTTPTLDRVWAATRPPELSADAFDRIWADVQRAYDDRPASLPMTRPVRARRRAVVLVALGLAQLAAAGLIAAWAWNRPGVPGDGVVKVEPAKQSGPVVVARLDVEADETLIIELGDGRASADRRPAPLGAAEGSLALLDLPEHTSSDMLNYLETLSR
ncbi:MAG TPA: hypothetical protein VGH33_27590 [Isosphaeraceae bacterium]